MRKVTRIPLDLSSYTSYDSGMPSNVPEWKILPLPVSNKILLSDFVLNQEDATLYELIDPPYPFASWERAGSINNSRFNNLLRLHLSGIDVTFIDAITRETNTLYSFISTENYAPYIYKNKVLEVSGSSTSIQLVRRSTFPGLFKFSNIPTTIDAPYDLTVIGDHVMVGDGNLFSDGILYIAKMYLKHPVGGFNNTEPLYNNNPNAEARIHLVGIILDEPDITVVLEEDFPAQAWDDGLYDGFETITNIYCAPITYSSLNYRIVIETSKDLLGTLDKAYHLYSLETDTPYVIDSGLVGSVQYTRSFFLRNDLLYGSSSPNKGDADTDHIFSIGVTPVNIGTIVTDLSMAKVDSEYLIGSLPVTYNDEKFGYQTYEFNIADALSFSNTISNGCSTGNYNGLITVLGGFPPYAIAQDISSVLPASFVYTDNGDGTASLTGVPNESGIYSLDLTITDSQGNTYSEQFPFEITGSPNITTTTLPEAPLNEAYSAQIDVS